MRIRWETYFLLSLLTGCGQKPPDLPVTEFHDSAGISIAYTPVDSTAPSCGTPKKVLQIGVVDGPSEYQLYGLTSATRLSDGRIVALNRSAHHLRVFSPAGDFLNQVGRLGGGPGEFRRNLWSVQRIEGDTLVVADYRPWRFSYFLASGEFIRAAELEPRIMERPEVAVVLPRGFLMGEPCCSPTRGFSERSVDLRLFTPDGALSDTLGRFSYDEIGWLSTELRYLGPPIFGATAAFAPLPDNRFVYANGREERAEIWSLDGELQKVVTWAGRDRTVEPEDVRTWKREAEVRMGPDPSPWVEATVGDHRPVAPEFPAHHGVFVTRTRYLWVREYPRPRSSEAQHLYRFDDQGRFVCQLRVPGDIAILELEDDHLLGRVRDELDVEYLVQYLIAHTREPLAAGGDL